MHSGVSAILPTHVFGNPCDVVEIDKIAKEWNVPVIYDAAHTYGVEIDGKSVMQFGDVSILSLHATKLFHSVEGGVLATDDDELANKLRYMRNFGFDGPDAFQGLGTNAKMSEFHAAMGLCLLPKMPEVIAARQLRVDRYDSHFDAQPQIQRQTWMEAASMNAAYYPIMLPSEADVLKVMDALRKLNIAARRYFHPCLSSLPYVTATSLPVAAAVSKRILCLPLYPDLELELVDKICKCINRLSNS